MPDDPTFESVCEELRRLAGHRAPTVLLGAGDLMQEAYLKLRGRDPTTFADRGHFLATAARAMRQITVDAARREHAQKRGGDSGPSRLSTDVPDAGDADAADRVLDVDAALAELSATDPRAAEVVTLRFFGGLGDAEIAAALGVTDRTVRRDWTTARTWLAERLKACPM